MPPSLPVSPPRPLPHPARTIPGTASAAMAMVAGAAVVAAEPIADRARVLSIRVTKGRFGAPYRMALTSQNDQRAPSGASVDVRICSLMALRATTPSWQSA
jgi:hypothetical protein